MALLEDLLKGNIVTAVAMGATALVLPKVMPDLSPPLRSAVKGIVSIFLESESEAEGGIIDRLAGTALKNVLHGLSTPGSTDHQQHAAHAAVEDFKRTAHARARRYGHNDADRSARFNRHIAALRRALDREKSRRTGASAATLQHLSAGLAKT
ncbi:MAG: hypothetical protein RQ966_20250 [Acetobacteraceae bacterium]|nr:hypothetical protein [Acetobacteraceae bacterium]